MNGTLANAIGMTGSALMVFAYAYSNLARDINFTLFNLVNLVGSLLLIISLTVYFNVASMTLEIVWALIALAGLVRGRIKQGKVTP